MYTIRAYNENNQLVQSNDDFGSDLYDWGCYAILSLNDLYSFGNTEKGRRFTMDPEIPVLMFGPNGPAPYADEPLFADPIYVIDAVAMINQGWTGPVQGSNF